MIGVNESTKSTTRIRTPKLDIITGKLIIFFANETVKLSLEKNRASHHTLKYNQGFPI